MQFPRTHVAGPALVAGQSESSEQQSGFAAHWPSLSTAGQSTPQGQTHAPTQPWPAAQSFSFQHEPLLGASLHTPAMHCCGGPEVEVAQSAAVEQQLGAVPESPGVEPPTPLPESPNVQPPTPLPELPELPASPEKAPLPPDPVESSLERPPQATSISATSARAAFMSVHICEPYANADSLYFSHGFSEVCTRCSSTRGGLCHVAQFTSRCAPRGFRAPCKTRRARARTQQPMRREDSRVPPRRKIPRPRPPVLNRDRVSTLLRA